MASIRDVRIGEPNPGTPLLNVRDLAISFSTPTGPVHAVRGVDLRLGPGEILGVVGESGCGKSVTFRGLLGLAPPSATVTGTVSVAFHRNNAINDADPGVAAPALRARSAMIYQNPGSALNPVFTIGRQLSLVADTDDEYELADLLDQVGLSDPKHALRAYPHEFSGGMQQRVVIAMALAQRPELLVADEPTTALDVTTQAQILDLLTTLRDQRDLGVVFISHDLAVVRRIADRIAVLYAGRVIETGPTAAVLSDPLHPYTRALIRSRPGAAKVGDELATIPGQVPDGRTAVTGCAFAPRCPDAIDGCSSGVPANRRPADDDARTVACVLIDGATS